MISPPDHLLTLDEWVALPEDNSRDYELQEGVMIARPESHMLHQRAAMKLAIELHHQLPEEWNVVGGVEVVTEPEFPASVRVPDVVVYREEAVGADTPHLVADQVLVAAEVVAPGTRMTDTVIKKVEYAKAGIPFYWVIDLDEPLSLTAYQAGEFGYQAAPAVTRVFETNEPFPVRIDLTELPDGPARQHGEVNQ